MIADSVRFIVDRGREGVYDAEHFFDGYKADRDYALATLRAVWSSIAQSAARGRPSAPRCPSISAKPSRYGIGDWSVAWTMS